MEVLEHFHQEVIFEIKFGWFDISITNLTISLFASAALFLILLILLARKPGVVPGKGQVVIELMLTFIKRNLVYNMIGKKEGDRWVPLVGGIFIFVLANNLIGLIPGLYTPTLNPMVPLTLAVIVFLIVQVTNLRMHGIRGLARTLAPQAVPSWMYVIVVPIESISMIAKPFSLFIRLTANMLAGHTIIFVLYSLILYFKNYFVAVPVIPFAVIMTIFEIFVSAIQAYIFAVLSALYIGEAVRPKH
ncbi:MAG: F0F1 ATP synthase subunit A [Actinobacteria bacterium]|nr:F0F1 ATP synthase subunit A [Actinomycetota bacterium]